MPRAFDKYLNNEKWINHFLEKRRININGFAADINLN